MLSSRARRVLLALVVPALAVTLLPSTATAARPGPGPGLPKLAAVARVYPHLADGRVWRVPADEVTGLRRDCEDGKVIEGAVGRAAFFSGKRYPTPRRPYVDVTTMRFGSVARAEQLMHRLRAVFVDCLSEDSEFRFTEFKAPVGEERFGYILRMREGRQSFALRWLIARDGRYLVLTGATSFSRLAPTLAPFVRFSRLAVRAAR